MRKKIVAGNWKMNKNMQEGLQLANEIDQLMASLGSDVNVIIAPPFIHISEAAKAVTHISVSAQNCASEASGAYTGEVSAAMLRSAGARYVILGHSERRAYYHEDNAMLNKKVKLALENNLKIIFCVGEQLEEREAGNQFDVVKNQLEEGIFDLAEKDFEKIIIAYEPVWAIGTGKTATPDQAQEIHKFIRDKVAEKYSQQLADNTSILYGGSCKPSNAGELFSNPDVDGGLIGGASLNAQDFMGIINAF
ncbi:MAG TPA: triose-phosphate isomerase [Bacteroidales bacterium]|nr:triose-phosphate isomerase [Bacteroidales bacterium]